MEERNDILLLGQVITKVKLIRSLLDGLPFAEANYTGHLRTALSETRHLEEKLKRLLNE